MEEGFHSEEPMSMKDLAEIFSGLNSHYERKGSQEYEEQGYNMGGTLPISIGELQGVFKSLA